MEGQAFFCLRFRREAPTLYSCVSGRSSSWMVRERIASEIQRSDRCGRMKQKGDAGWRLFNLLQQKVEAIAVPRQDVSFVEKNDLAIAARFSRIQQTVDLVLQRAASPGILECPVRSNPTASSPASKAWHRPQTKHRPLVEPGASQ